MNTATDIEDDDVPILAGVVEQTPRVEVALGDQPTPIPDDPRNAQDRVLLSRHVREPGDYTEFVAVEGLRHIGLEIVRFRAGRRPFSVTLWHAEYAMLASVLPGVVERARTLMVSTPKRNTNPRHRQNQSSAPAHRPGVPRGATSPK